MEIAALLGRPATHDSQYTAEREGCELWTADERFWNAVRAHSRGYGGWAKLRPSRQPAAPEKDGRLEAPADAGTEQEEGDRR